MTTHKDIKTWQERVAGDSRTYAHDVAFKAEIADLRSYAEQVERERDEAKQAFEASIKLSGEVIDDRNETIVRLERERDALREQLDREMRDAQTLATLLRKERERFEFLHSTNKDADGWEWGVARIRAKADGGIEYLWGVSDHSDIDAARGQTQSPQPVGAVVAESTDIPFAFVRFSLDYINERKPDISDAKIAEMITRGWKGYEGTIWRAAVAAQTEAPQGSGEAKLTEMPEFVYAKDALIASAVQWGKSGASCDAEFYLAAEDHFLDTIDGLVARHPAPEAQGVDELTAVHKFLLGEGDIDGLAFGEKDFSHQEPYWWRKNLRAALAKQGEANG